MGPEEFRKRSVTIQAMRWEPGNLALAGGMAGWLVGAGVDFRHPTGYGATTTLAIVTLEGEMLAQPGDWIIRGVAGEFYPCKPDIFEQTYERI